MEDLHESSWLGTGGSNTDFASCLRASVSNQGLCQALQREIDHISSDSQISPTPTPIN
jgi:hypothetical protein